MHLNRNGQTRGSTFVTSLDHVKNELLELIDIQFRESKIKMKTAKTIAKSNHPPRPQVVVNYFPENQDLFNRSKLVSG